MSLRTKRPVPEKAPANVPRSVFLQDSAVFPTEASPAHLSASPTRQESVDGPEQAGLEQPTLLGHRFETLSVAAPQAKLAVSQPADPLEQEADRIADEVVALSPLGALEPQGNDAQSLRGGGHSTRMLGQPLAHSLDTAGESGNTSTAPTASPTSSGGEPLSGAAQRYMQPRFGHDFSQVRVHSDHAANRSAEALNAQAYTLGNDVVFAAGKYAPGTRDGDRLLAHELSHVLQQTGGKPFDEKVRRASSIPAGSVLQRAPKTADDPFGIGFSPIPSPPQFTGPLGVLLEEVAEGTAKPDPADPYEQPGLNWDSAAAPVSGPMEPEPWSPPPIRPASPLPYQRYDGKPSTHGVTPLQKQKATRCEAAFAAAVAVLEGSWTSASPGIKDFHNAAKDAAGLGLTTISGEGWNPPTDNSQNLSQFADQQTTGPEGQKTAVKDLFKPGGTDSQVDVSGVAKSESLDKSLKDALVTAEQDVVKAAHGYSEAMGRDRGRAQAVKIAQNELKLTEEKSKAADAESAVSSLEKEKKEASEAIETSVKLIESVIDVVGAVEKADPLALAKTGVGIGGVLMKMASDEEYDRKIAQAGAKVSGLKGLVQGLKDVIGVEKVEQAVGLFESQRTEVDTARINFKQAVAKRKDAYDTFAKAAGAAAGGGEAGAKVQAAIQAIPIVETVVARIQKVTGVIRLPVYDDDSGIGYRAVGAPMKFVSYLAQLKGYKGFFDEQHGTWSDRLKSLQKQATGLFSKPGAPL